MGFKGTLAYLSLGSNLGDRLVNLEGGIEFLRNSQTIRLLKISPLYDTKPWQVEDQPNYLNCAVSVSSLGGARDLLNICQEAEIRAGRLGKGRKSPRPLDVDILLFGDLILDTVDLIIPHPRLAQRRFVLVPLADIAPNLIVPGINQPVRKLLNDCSDHSEVQRVGEVIHK